MSSEIPNVTEELVYLRLADIVDPELMINIVDPGLIYDVKLEMVESPLKGYAVAVKMTLTSMACPIGPSIQAAAHNRVMGIDGVVDADVELVFDPPWDPREHASEEAQMMLGVF